MSAPGQTGTLTPAEKQAQMKAYLADKGMTVIGAHVGTDKTEEQLLKKLESELGRTTEPCALAPHPPRRPEDNPRQGARLSVRHR